MEGYDYLGLARCLAFKYLNQTKIIEPSKPKMSAEDKARARRDLEALQKQEEDLLRQISERE